jgi:hypothetical protein
MSSDKINDTHYLKAMGCRIEWDGDRAMEMGAVGALDDVQRSSMIRVRETHPVASVDGGDVPSGGWSQGRRARRRMEFRETQSRRWPESGESLSCWWSELGETPSQWCGPVWAGSWVAGGSRVPPSVRWSGRR